MTHRQKELVEMLLKQAGYKEEGRMYVNHSVPSAIGIKELFPDEVDDSDLWDEVLNEYKNETNSSVFATHQFTQWMKSKYKLSRK